MNKFLKSLAVSAVLFFTVLPSFAQIDIGISGGVNLSKPDGTYFRSAGKVGLQVGAFLTYHLTDHFALQGEPSFNVTRIRANDEGKSISNGLNKGNKSVQFFNLPLYAKLKITPNFAIVGGPEYNKILNDGDFRLNDGAEAFKDSGRFGYGLGLDIGNFYFRYRSLKKFDEIGDTHDLKLNQYQIGFRWKLL
ncbi:hypothetical protein FM107_01600 [Sphingobacterium sp. JB170]|nr:hypothetical protein FM107_01600 [Sphingobacterium sp. JB170]